MSLEIDIKDLKLAIAQEKNLERKDQLSGQLLALTLQKGHHRIITTAQISETMQKAAEDIGDRQVYGITN